MKEFPHCDWGSSCLADADEDSLWASYESIYGGAAEYTGLRESKDTSTIAARSALFFEWLAARPEREIAIVSHAAFLRTTMSFGTHRQDFASLGIEPLVSTLHGGKGPPSRAMHDRATVDLCREGTAGLAAGVRTA